ncbi:MAG: DUF2905 domain-containing protein [Saprospiraceae bacterium]|nr:DUF2905 domain-containing protein [Saprospiraceae bacterium]MBK9728671.1 DUF2905 domain-containing protein [Saprospiraceae bacterium]
MSIAKLIILLGCVLIILGLFWNNFLKIFSWFGNLPGDIKWENEQSKFYFPLVSMLLISLLLNLILYIYRILAK